MGKIEQYYNNDYDEWGNKVWGSGAHMLYVGRKDNGNN